jgi:hypothetical protein
VIFKLTPDSVVKYWDQIRFAALSTVRLSSTSEEYSAGLLSSLMSGKMQCWFIVSDDDKLKTVALTRIQEDGAGVKHLIIDCGYGYSPTTKEDKGEIIKYLMAFARNTGCRTVYAYTDNPMAGNAMEKMGMAETMKIYSREVSHG